MSAESLSRRASHIEEERRLVTRIREAVGDRGIAEFSRILELNHESVRRYVRGMTSPPAVFLMRIVERLGVDANWLLVGDDTRISQTLHTIDTVRLAAELERRAAAIGWAASRGQQTASVLNVSEVQEGKVSKQECETRTAASHNETRVGVSDTNPSSGGKESSSPARSE
ncbi:MAG: helix-turn-helix domain-containing protein [Phycisphaerales bacterium JB058]